MKIRELSRPHLFLDMDGVQSDFFGAWAEHHNVPSYKDIPDPEAAIDLLASTGYDNVYRFFAELKPLSGGIRIIHWLKMHHVSFTVLSAPLRGQEAASIHGKKDWLDKYNPGTSEHALFDNNKAKYATKNGQPHVLVDDFGKYLTAWDAAGGIAVKHTEETADQTIEMLEKIYGIR